jgi:hypothetical protein
MTASYRRAPLNGALAARGQLNAEMSTQGSAQNHAQIDAGLVVVIQARPYLPDAIGTGIPGDGAGFGVAFAARTVSFPRSI